MSVLNEQAPLLLRICLVILFPFSAFDKIRNWSSALKQAASMPLPKLMLVLSIIVELLAPACILSGWHDRAAAFVLAGFCVLTAILFHQFWRDPKFWKFQEGEGLQHFWDFLKNFGLVGGLGLIVLAPRASALGERPPHLSTGTVASQPHVGEPRSLD